MSKLITKNFFIPHLRHLSQIDASYPSLKRWVRLWFASLIVLSVVFTYVYTVRAVETRFNITDGTYVRSSSPDVNYGTATQWTVSKPGYDAYIDLGNEYFNGATLYIYKTATNVGYMRVMSVDYFDEDDLTWNTAEYLDSECIGNTTVYEQGWHTYDVSGCGRYIALNGTNAGAGNFYSDDYTGGNNPYVLYDSDYAGNFIHFIPDVNQTNSTNITFVYYASSNIFHYGSYQLYLRFNSEAIYSGTANIDSLTYTNISSYLNNPLYNLSTVNITVQLNDAVGLIANDTIIYDRAYSPLPVETPGVIDVPDFTPYPMPTWSVDQNTSINGSKLSNWTEYMNGTVSNINGSAAGVFGFISVPVSNMRGFVQFVDNALVSSSFNTSNSIISIICPCLISSIHWKIKSVITFSLLLMTVLIIMRKK